MDFPTLPGVFTASLTPLDSNLEPDLEALIDHAMSLMEEGSDGVALLGSTGEANSLTLEQRLKIIENVPGSLSPEHLMLGTGSCSLQDAVVLTKAGMRSGVRTVLVLPPFYYRPQSDDGAFRYFSEIIESVGDEKLRVVFYNFPQLSGYSFSIEILLKLRERFGPTAAGIKDSSGDWENMKRVANEIPDFSVYAGTERFLLDVLREGGAGCITATGNLTSPGCREVYRAWRAGDQEEADGAQERLTRQRLVLQNHPFVSGLKSLMGLKTGRSVWCNMLPPFVPLSDDKAALFAREAAETGLDVPASG